MEEPKIAQKAPYGVAVKKGEIYYWCACGRSSQQPFCNGSHAGTSFKPVAFKADQDGTLYLCGCKHTGKKPYCDGTHKKL